MDKEPGVLALGRDAARVQYALGSAEPARTAVTRPLMHPCWLPAGPHFSAPPPVLPAAISQTVCPRIFSTGAASGGNPA